MSIDVNALVKATPLYRELYGDALEAFDIATNAFNYPTLEKKHIIRNFPNNFMTEDLSRMMLRGELEFNASSGTTSERMQIVRCLNWWADENRRTYAFDEKLKPFSLKRRKAVLTTAICSNTVCFAKLPSYEERVMGMNLYLNISPDPNLWNETDIWRMIAEINQYQPDVFDVDPIYLAIMLRKMEQYGISTPIHRPKVIIYTYEYATFYAKSFIDRFFKDVPTITFYGSTETGYNLFEMPDGRFKHVEDQCKLDIEHFQDDIYFLKISSWKNECMPLINYRIGDLVRIGNESLHLWSNHGESGGLRIVDQLCGRFFDAIETMDGRYITVGDVEREMAKHSVPILLYQLRFLDKTHCRFRYVTTHQADIAETKKMDIRHGLRTLYGERLEVEFAREKSIGPELSGKFRILKKG